MHIESLRGIINMQKYTASSPFSLPSSLYHKVSVSVATPFLPQCSASLFVPVRHGPEPLKLPAKVKLSSLKLFVFRHLAQGEKPTQN